MTLTDFLEVADDLPEPLELFRRWYAAARATRSSNHPGAVCLSTVDKHGVPEGRFVDLKIVTDRGFVFGTHMDSPKARCLALNPTVAMTFWCQFEQHLDDVRRRFVGVDIPRPDHWGGYCVVPSRIEFLAFRASRLHERVLFERASADWRHIMLQP